MPNDCGILEAWCRAPSHGALFLQASLLGLLLALPAQPATYWPTHGLFDAVIGEPAAVVVPELPVGDAAATQDDPPPKRESQRERRARVAPLIAAAAARHDVPIALLTAVVRVESNFDHNAVSPKGAVGLMQLMPGTARYLGVHDARDPAANVDAGARYLKRLLRRFDNDLALALAAYNAGPGVVERNGRTIPDYVETRQYVAKVIDHYQGLLGQSGTVID